MKPVQPTVAFAVRTAKGERRRIRSFFREIESLGVDVDALPGLPVKALTEADRFLGRYLDLLDRETPSAQQLEGVMESLGGIDRVVRNAMGEILRALGWTPEGPARERTMPLRTHDSSRAGAAVRPRAPRTQKGEGAVIIPFPGPRPRRTTR